MAVTKRWAYITEFGSERITAWAIRQERHEYGGASLGKTYWSAHKPGLRRPVKQVQKAGATFFAYINGTDAVGPDGGESLTHRLFKEAIAGLSGTRLKLGSAGEHEITITHSEVEKKIHTANGPYYADVYLLFTSTTNLGLRWSGELYVEVNHTHALPPYKQEDLRQARLPVVEVDVPQVLEYTFEDEYTTDPREAAYVNRIQNILQNGFLAGRVVSDRRSLQYLEQEVTRLEKKLQQAQQDRVMAERGSDEVLQRLKQATEREANLQSTINGLTQQKERVAAAANDFGSKLAVERKNVRTLSQSLSEAREVVEKQQKEIRFANLVGFGIISLMVCLSALVLYQHFIVPREDEATQAVVASQPKQAVVPQPSAGKSQKGPPVPRRVRTNELSINGDIVEARRDSSRP